MNRSTRAISSLSKLLVSLAIVCVPVVGRATTVATPTFSPAAGTYTSAQSVTISDTTSGATCYYTLTAGTTGTTPTTSSPLYTSPITVSASSVLEALCTYSGDTNSAAAKAVYTLQVPTPAFSPVAGSYTSIQTVGISDSNTAAAIYYTTNGSTPTTASAVYSGPITVSATETIKAIAVISGDSNSAAGSAAYTIKLPTASTPTFSPVAGTYSNAQTVTISDATSGATIYYTTDGTSPTTLSTVYSGPVSVISTGTLKAIASAYNYSNSSVVTAAYTLKVPTPTFSPVAGTYTSIQTMTISDTDSAATIYYTTNGTTPTTSSNLYTGAIKVGATQTIEAIATASGYPNSAVGSAAYTIKLPPVATPTFSPVAGTYTSIQTVTISDSNSAATIYYTTDGTIPTTASVAYSGPITVSSAETLKAIATATGYSTSAVGTAAYALQTPTPTFSPATGTYTSIQTVAINDTNASATIYYTTNGATPATSSTLYSGPITVSSTETLKAIATAPGYTTSATGSAVYTIKLPLATTPTFSPVAGTYASTQTVTISEGTSGATIYYTTDGTTPTTASAVYSGPVTVSATETLKAIATAYDYSNSAMATAAYTLKVPTPTLSPAAGSFGNSQTVTISDANAAATIYYTVTSGTTGSAPTTSSNLYSGPITVNSTETLEAIAVVAGYTNSASASATYTLVTPTPTFSPAAGTYTSIQEVAISDSNSAAAIYYTTNGSTPTTASTLYSGPITVSATETIKAIAAISGNSNSAVGSAAYTIKLPTAATPTFSPVAGSYTSVQTVTISDATSGATIYYTTNGSTPTTASTVYTGPITVASTETLKAIATVTGYATSAVGSAAYTLKLPSAATPTFSPSAGTYTNSQSVTIADVTGGATIYYTTNGSTPTTASSVYGGPIMVSSTETLEAIATATGYSQSTVGSAAYTITPPTATPSFSPTAGTYTSMQTVTIADATSGATIYYTTNGTTPTTSSTLYSGPITVSLSETIAAIATATGHSNSAVASAAFVISPPAATPTFSLAAGTYTSMQTVTIADATSGATIYYTTNGNPPTTSSSVYSSPITVVSTETVQAMAIAAGYAQSAVATVAYIITPPAATPVFNPVAGAYSVNQTVTISDATSGSTIYYTTNGSTPTTASSIYSGPVTVTSTETIEAIAIATGYSQSAVATATYTVMPPAAPPMFNPVAGAYSVSQSVNITDATSGATIYYTTNGTTPTTSSTVYSGPILVSSTETFEAIATATGYSPSAVTTAAYMLGAPAATPVLSPAAGSYNSAQTVTISDPTPGATIYYTTDGTTPTTSSSVYTSPITVASTETIQAYAVATSFTPSAVGSAAYTIVYPPVITGLTPSSGFPGTFVRITGTSFGSYVSGTSSVTFNGVTAQILSWTTTAIQTVAPSAMDYPSSPSVTTGPVIVNAANPPSTSTLASNAVQFTVPTAPSITGVNPVSGPIGTSVTISGFNFGTSQAAGTVTFNGVAATPTSWGADSIIVPAPTGATTGPVVVSVSGATSNNYVFTISAGISGILPAQGSVGTVVTISGLGFGALHGTSVVSFNGVAATPSSWSDTAIVVPVPNGATTGTIAVLMNGVSITGPVFTLVPSITSLSPSVGPVASTVTISGSNYGPVQGSSTVAFGQVLAIPTQWSKNKIVVPVPAGAVTSSVVVTVAGQASNAMLFTVGASITATITGVVTSASDGTPLNGVSIQVLQSNAQIGSATSATNGVYSISGLPLGTYDLLVSATGFGSTVVSGINLSSSGSTTVNVSLGTPGTIAGSITQSDGVTPISGATVIVAEGSDTVATAVTNTSGAYSVSNLGVTSYSLQASASGYGTQNQTGVSVTAGQTTTANFSLSGQSVITYTYDEVGRLVGVTDSIKGSATYTYDAVGNILSISRVSPGQLAILDFTPKSGLWGSTVTISGTSFGSSAQQDAVTIGGVAATITSATSNQIVVTVPANAITGPITVTAPSGTAESSTSFTVDAITSLPLITSFQPAIANIGGTVTLTGSGFDLLANDRVKFNGVVATVTSALPSILTTTVPAGAESGPISLATSVGVSTSNQDFFVVPTAYTPSQVDFTGRMAIGEGFPGTINTGGDIGIVLFNAASGQMINFQVVGSTIANANITILNPDGSFLVQSAIVSGNTTISPLPAPATGTYTILVASSGASSTGSLILGLFNQNQPFIAPGTAQTVTVNTPGQSAQYMFVGTAGQMASVQLSNSTFGCCVTVSILSPDGTTLGSTYTSGTSVSLNPIALPATGIYTVVIAPNSSSTGSASLSLSLFNEQTGATITPGTPAAITISTPGQTDSLTFSGTAGQMATVQLFNSTFGCCVTVSILSPDGTSLVSSNTSGTSPIALPATGTYTVVIATYNGATGSASLNVSLFNELTGGTITPGTPAAVSVNIPGQTDSLTFSGTAGQMASVQLSNSTFGCCVTVSILSPDGATLITGNAYGSSFALNPIALPATGTYTVLIAPYNGATGSASVNVTLFSQQAPVAITAGTPATVTINTPGQYASLTFTGTAGQLASVLVSNSTFPGCSSVNVSLVSPDGTTLGSSGSGCSSSWFQNPVTLPISGTYTILIVPSGGGTGSASVSLWLFNQQTPAAIASGTPTTVTVNNPGDSASLTFTGTAGQLASLQISNSTFPGCWSVNVSLVSPDGTTLGSSGNGCSTSWFQNPVTLPISGTYTILIVPSGGGTGSASVNLWLFNQQVPVAIASGTPATVTVDTPGESASLTFTGTAGQLASLQITNSTFPGCWSVNVSLVSPDGTTLGSSGNGCSTSWFQNPVTLPISGTYTILIVPSGGGTGSASVNLWLFNQQAPATITAGTPATVAINTPGQSASLTFSGTAGQLASLQISNSTFPGCWSVNVSLVSPDGTTLGSSGNGCSTSWFQNPVTLPISGTYTILIVPSGGGTGSTSVNLWLFNQQAPGSITVETPATVTVNNPGDSASLTFTGTAGQLASLQITNSTFPGCWSVNVSLVSPDGTTLGSSGNGCSSSWFQNPVTLPISGTYTILITPSGGGTGSASVNLWLFNQQAPTDITTGTPATVAINTPGQSASLTFSGMAGQLASLQISNSTFPGCWSVNVSLVSPDGSTLGSSGNGCSSSWFQNPVTLPISGTYTILIVPSNGGTGSASVNLWLFNQQAPVAITAGTPATVSINIPGQSASLTFAGTAGQLASVQISNSTFPGCWSVNVSLVSPDGSTLGSSGNGCSSSWFQNPVTLPISGTYTILIMPSNGGTGSASVNLWLFNQQTPVTIASGTPATLTVDTPGESASLTFTGTAGQLASVQISNSTFPGCWSVNVSLVSPDGTTLGSSGNGCSSSWLLNPVTLPISGTYTILITPSGGGTGSASVNLWLFNQQTPVAIASGTPATVTVNTPGDAASLTFTGTVGQLASVQFSNSTFGCCVTVSILSPDGTTLISNNTGGSSLSLNPIALPATGTYTVVIAPYNGATGSASVTAWVFNELTGTAITPGTPTAVSINNPGQTNSLTFSGTAGQYASVQFSNSTFGCCVTVSILSPDGSTLISGNTGGSLSLNPIALPATGTYTVLIAPYNGTTGSASVTAWVFNELTGSSLTPGTPTAVAINNPGQTTSLAFSGTAGQYASVLFSDSTFGCCVTVSILNPDGTTLITENTGNTSLFLSSVALPATGTYSVLIAPYNGTVGGANITVWTFDQQTGTTITSGAPTAVAINTPGQTASLTFNGTAGQSASIVLNNSTFNCWTTSVSILSPDGTTLASSNSCGNLFLNPVTLPVSGTYTIVITPTQGVTGSASITLWLFNNLAPAVVTPDTPATVTINTPGQAASLTFSGTAGQQASVQLTNSTFACWTTSVSILSPDGATLASSNSCGNLVLNTITLPVSGTYTIVISPTSGATGSASVILSLPSVLMSVTPPTAILSAGQYAQFTATVQNNTNTAVTWTISSTVGSISASGLYTAPVSIPTQQTVTVTATSLADPTQLASATVTLVPAPQCTSGASNGYSYQRAIVIDHTKVPNTDQTNFPFLFNNTDPLLATTTNGGHVTNPNGYDIIFTSDAAGQNVLNYEMEEYNPATGQVIAWVRVPTLSHMSDTLIYVFYGNSSVTALQQNPTGVWDSNFAGVWHLDSTGAVLSYPDSTANSNNGIVDGSPQQISGEILGGLDFTGSSDNLAIRSIPLNNEDYTVSAWFSTPLPNTGSWNTLTRGATNDHQVLVYEGNWHLGAYANTAGGFQDSGFAINSLSNGWHHLAAAASTNSGTTTFYIDGSQVGSIPFKSSADIGYLGNYQGGGQQFGQVDEMRISSGIARSADWIATEYSNQSSPSTFYTLYAENAVAVVPASVNLYAGQSQQFTAIGVCGVNWSLPSGAPGVLTATGFYTAPANVTPQQTIMVTATGVVDQTQSASATVTLMAPAGVSVAPLNTTLYGGWTQQFTATVANATNTAVTWTISPAGVGAITSSGLYTAPITIATQQTVTITATSQAEPSQSASATLTLMPVTITSGTSQTVAINTPGQVEYLTFTGTAGQYASVQFSNYNFSGWCCSGLNVSILNPDGTTLVSSTLNPGTMLQNPVLLPATGTYTLVIAPQNGITGSVSVTLSLFSEQSGTTITPGTPATVAISIPGQTDSMTFTASAGQYASVQLSNYNFTGWCCSGLSVSIVNPDGTTLVTTNMNPGTMAQNPVILPATGTYTLVIAPQNGITGSVNVSLSVFNEETGTNLTSGIPTAVAINNPGQTDSLTFSGTAGQYASVLFSNSTFGCCVTVSILSPDGSTLISNNTSSSSLSLNPIALPATGTYTVLIAPYNGATGSASVTAWVFNEMTGASLTPGTAAAVSINNPGQTDSLTFSGTAGQYASVLFSNSTFGCCVTVSILNPDGTTLISTNTSSSSLALSPTALPATGTYTVLIAPYNGATGSASVTAWVFSEQTDTAITPGTPTAVAINNPGQTDSLTFSGTAGQYASVLFSDSTFGCCVTVSILNPDGTTLISNNTGNSSMVLNPVALPVTGTYTLLIAPYNGATGSASVTAWVFNEQTGTTLTSGTPTAVTINTPGQTALLTFSGAAGQFVSTLFSNSTFGCCVTVSVLNPDGSTLISNNTSGSLLLNPVALPVTGTYTVLIAPYNGTTGSASVTIWEFSEQAGATLISGAPASVTINTPGQTSSLTFSGSVGQYASVLFDSSTYGCCVTVSVLNPDGTTLISNNTGGSLLLSPVALPATGTYTVVISPYNGATGTANVTVWVFNEQTGTTIAPNTPTSVAINTPGQTASLTFSGTAGQYASVLLSNSTYGCCVTVSVLNPDGSTLISNNTGGSLLLNPVVLPVTGTYTLVVAPYNGATGSASLNLWLFSELTGTTITSGTPALVTINNPGQTDSLTFTGTIGQYASVLFDNSSFGCCVTVSILKPDGSTLISNDTGGSLVLNPVALPATGTYTVLIAPYNGATGSASVTAWTFNEQTGTTITPSTPATVSINIPGQTDSLTFSGTAGQYVSALVNNSTFGCCVTVSILNPDGTTLISNNTGGSSLALSPVALPATGTYTVLVAPYNGATGSASVTFWLFNEQTGGTITPTTPTAVAISTPGQTDSLTFSGTAGQYASLLFSNSTFGCCATVSILNPDGSILASNNTGGTSMFLNPVALPATGIYTVVIAPNNDATGIASITLWLFNEQTGAAIAPATPTTVAINTPGQTDSLTFSGTAGQYVSALLSNSTFGCCVTVSILNPDGSTLISNYAYGSSLALNPVALPATGTYTLVIAPSNGNTGSASVTLWLFDEQTGGTIASGTPTAVAISIPGQTDSMTFSGTAGQYVSALLSNSTFGCCVTVSILKPDGSALITANTGGSSLALNPVALPAAGTYTVVIAPSNGSTGSASVTLWLFNEQTGGTITSGTPTAVAIDTPGQTDSLTFTGTAGQYASALLSNSTFGCCVVLSILNPDGTTLISGNGSGLSVALNSVMLPATGTYTLVIAPSNGATGSATIALWFFNQLTGGTISSGTPTTVAISIPGQTESMTFSGSAGQYASFELSGSTFACCVTVSILNPDGTTLVTSNTGVTTLNLGPVALPATGTYTLVIAPNSGATGTATASLWVFSELTGSITPGTPTAVTINIPGQTDSLTFNGGAGQVASVQISNSTFGYYPMVSILNPDGTTLTSTYAYGSSVVLGPFTLPASGTYTLVIGSSNGYLVAGSASVTLLLNNGTSQSVTAPITPATPTMVSISNPGQIDNFIFSGTTGQFVSMELTNATFGCCVSASILNPDGSTLISNYTGGTSLTLGPVALPTTGTYTLVIAPYSGSLITGNASVTLWLFSEQAGTVITPGTLTPVAINTPGQSDTMTFSGTAGQYASVQLANSTFACCVAVSILNPDGSTLISNNTAGSSLSLGSIALPATGTYTLVIAPYNDNLITGTAQVTLWLFSAPTSAAITPGTPTAVAISIPGQSDSLTFTGTAGQYASLQLSNSSFGCCASVSILNPDGSTLISNYTGSASLALGPVALPVTGTYSLVIAPYSGNLITGSASVTLWLFSEQTGATILPGTSMPIAINIPGQSASMTFSGNAGQNASVQLSSSTFGCCAVVSILNPDGSTLISNNATGASLTLGPDALPETGTYTLVIAPYSGYLITGSANVTLNFQ